MVFEMSLACLEMVRLHDETTGVYVGTTLL